MPEATLTSKGQVTVPAAVRQALRIGTGDKIDFVEVGEGRFEVVAATRSIREFAGMFAGERRAVSVEEMNEATASEGSRME